MATGEFIVMGFRQNGYIDYTEEVDNLQSNLRVTLSTHEVPRDVLIEVDEFINVYRMMDLDEENEEVLTREKMKNTWLTLRATKAILDRRRKVWKALKVKEVMLTWKREA